MAMPARSPLVPDTSRRDWTVEELSTLPDDGNRYEVIDGELLVSPAPSWTHQRAAGECYVLLRDYANTLGVDCLIAPAAVTFSDRQEVQPDIFVLPRIDGRRAPQFSDVKRLLLAVEVISPSTARADRYVKRRLYQSERIPEYWVIDVDARFVERWRPDSDAPDVLVQTLTWQPDVDTPPLTIDLPTLFRAIVDG